MPERQDLLRFTALVSGQGWHVQDLLRAAEAVGIRLAVCTFESISLSIGSGASGNSSQTIRAGTHVLNDEDAVLVRMMPPAGLEPIVFRMDALHRLVEMGVPVFDPPRTVEMAVDKALSLARLQGEGIEVPATWVGESADEAVAAFEALGGDVVVKPLFGSEGRGLVRVDDRETCWRVCHALERVGSVLYLQEYVPNDGWDARFMTLGGSVLAAMRRFAPAGDWRANVAQGAKAEAWTQAPGAVCEIADRVSQVIGGSLLGVDLVRHRDGRWLVLEVNAVPGWRALAGVTGVDVAKEWLLFVKKSVR